LLLHVVAEDKLRLLLEKSIPKRVPRSVTFNGIICGCEESASVEPVESRNETCPLKKTEERGVVRVGGECIDESSCSGGWGG
jgi:hypothetical protein